VPRSTSRSSTTPGPERRTLDFGAAPALSIDVEEWYHNCWVEEYVDPALRPSLPEELDRLLPSLLERLDRTGAKGTFFVLGEVARRLPANVREVADAGHEVACHGELHLRANNRTPAAFRVDIEGAKARLEDLIGGEVVGFRAPEWSLRSASNPRLRLVAEAGFRYDSSLMPSWGAGDSSNPTHPTLFTWSGGQLLIELPPLTWGAARFRLPASGWTGRLLGPARLAAIARAAGERGRLPLMVIHPWEIVDRPCPGLYTGLARLFHEAGRHQFASGFDELLDRLRPRATLARRSAELGFEAGATAQLAAVTNEAAFGRLAQRAAR
jgi:peptidoglycan/xylan/chitin deacetylase (PgdA/CDA1 family)